MLLAATEAERGPLSLVQGQLDPRTLRWLQEGPHWRSLPKKIGRKQGRVGLVAQERKFTGYCHCRRPLDTGCWQSAAGFIEFH